MALLYLADWRLTTDDELTTATGDRRPTTAD
jgi:hypothetical protein